MKYWNAAFLERLLQVQSTDLEIRRLDHQIQIYYQRSKEEDAELTRLKMEIADIDEAIESTEGQNQMYSTTLDDIRSAIKGLLTTKSGVPKPRTRSSTEALKIEEDKLAALVDETAEHLGVLRGQRETLLIKAAERAQTLEKSQEGPEAEIRKLQTQIKKLEKQRGEETEGLPKMLLKHYDRLRSSRSGIGLTILRDGVCTVCRMQMPTAVVSRMSKGERVPACPACGRMVARIEIINLIPKDEESAADATDKTAKAAAKKAKAKKVATKKAAKKTATAKKATKKSAEAKVETVPAEAEKKPASKKKVAKKESAAEKAPPAKKTAAKKPAAAKKATQKGEAKAEPAKKPESKAPSSAAKKAAKKSTDKKAPAKKSAEKKAPAKKSAAKKSETKKVAAKTSAKSKATKSTAKK